jgi:hypothetical protein
VRGELPSLPAQRKLDGFTLPPVAFGSFSFVTFATVLRYFSLTGTPRIQRCTVSALTFRF